MIADSHQEALRESALPLQVRNRANDYDLHVQLSELRICNQTLRSFVIVCL